MTILSIILSIIALAGSVYSYIRTDKTIQKIDLLDDAIFRWMKEDFNSKVDQENKD